MWASFLKLRFLWGPRMYVYSCIICWFAWQSHSLSTTFVLLDPFVVLSLASAHSYSGLYFWRRLFIAKAVTFLLAMLNFDESWMFLMIELLVNCR